MKEHGLHAWIEGIGLLGPGISDWAAGARLLRGQDSWIRTPAVLPLPEGLPAAERRRTGAVVKLALAVGREATRHARADAASLPAVFTSSGGDGQNCHEICQVLASSERQISPTRFHNSVHNAAAGYWGIAAGATPASNALCAYDASFAAGLIEALTQLTTERRPVLLIAYDTGYPEPIHAARPIPDACGVAMVLAPANTPAALARIEAHFTDAPAEALKGPLEELRRTIPAARALPLLECLARGTAGTVVLEYLPHASLSVEVTPCR